MVKITAIEALKGNADRPHLVDGGRALRQLVIDKGYSPAAVRKLALRNNFGTLFNSLVLRQSAPTSDEEFNRLGLAIHNLIPGDFTAYTGTDKQNSSIDIALSSNPELRAADNFFGAGVATTFTQELLGLPTKVRSVPVAVIGNGASGILISHALREVLGFSNVTVYEKSKDLGIWSNPNVSNGSRNNPRRLEFQGEILDPAPGGGDEIADFLESLSFEDSVKANIVRVRPGMLNHTLEFGSGNSQSYPIVINASGMGRPKPISDPRKITTSASSGGQRWQVRLERDDVEGKRFVFIGLGNSTAEMINQLYSFMDDGANVDFRVVTHYPEDSIRHPDSTVVHEDRLYRVFRDLSAPNLVDYQGDLPDSRHDYFRALREDRILHSVSDWALKDNNIVMSSGYGKRSVIYYPYDKLFTLIGYKHSAESLASMGCGYDSQNDCGLFDFDGEMQSSSSAGVSPASRVHKGYFGFGSILETPLNPNAIVIPGMLHRIGDQLFSVALRATEYANQL